MVWLVVVQKYIKVFFGKYWLRLLNMQEDSKSIIFNQVLVEDFWKTLEGSTYYIEIKSQRFWVLLDYVEIII